MNQSFEIKREATLYEVLAFREKKMNLRQSLLQENPGSMIVAVGMNIPGPIKNSLSIWNGFKEGCRNAEEVFANLRCEILHKEVMNCSAGCAAIYCIKGNATTVSLKRQLIQLEETHSLGRLWDFDVWNGDGCAISRTDLWKTPRTCLICGEDAKICGRSRTHTVLQLQEKVWEVLNAWQAEKIGELAYQSALEEVYTTPKPGLVDLLSNGAHKDMDVHTFEKSAEAIRPYFVKMAKEGLVFDGALEILFAKIRSIGKSAEQAMFEATGGVNTHKGLIFSLGIYCTVVGRSIKEDEFSGKSFEDIKEYFNTLRNLQMEMTGECLERELLSLKEMFPKTHGEQNLLRYGTGGVRMEAIKGYPSVFELAIPTWYMEEPNTMEISVSEVNATESSVMKSGTTKSIVSSSENRKLQVLLILMSQVEDSNILARHNPEVLQQTQKEICHFLANGGVYQKDAYNQFVAMDLEFSKQGISAGGCADLLALTLFLVKVAEWRKC